MSRTKFLKVSVKRYRFTIEVNSIIVSERKRGWFAPLASSQTASLARRQLPTLQWKKMAVGRASLICVRGARATIACALREMIETVDCFFIILDFWNSQSIYSCSKYKNIFKTFIFRCLYSLHSSCITWTSVHELFSSGWQRKIAMNSKKIVYYDYSEKYRPLWLSLRLKWPNGQTRALDEQVPDSFLVRI